MLSKIKHFFAPSTAKAIKGFTKATNQLRAVAELEHREVARQTHIMNVARGLRDDAEDRAAEADRLANKFQEFLA